MITMETRTEKIELEYKCEIKVTYLQNNPVPLVYIPGCIVKDTKNFKNMTLKVFGDKICLLVARKGKGLQVESFNNIYYIPISLYEVLERPKKFSLYLVKKNQDYIILTPVKEPK